MWSRASIERVDLCPYAGKLPVFGHVDWAGITAD